jgi:hypothetical protein
MCAAGAASDGEVVDGSVTETPEWLIVMAATCDLDMTAQ